jgi:hypothetical protein
MNIGIDNRKQISIGYLTELHVGDMKQFATKTTWASASQFWLHWSQMLS